MGNFVLDVLDKEADVAQEELKGKPSICTTPRTNMKKEATSTDSSSIFKSDGKSSHTGECDQKRDKLYSSIPRKRHTVSKNRVGALAMISGED